MLTESLDWKLPIFTSKGTFPIDTTPIAKTITDKSPQGKYWENNRVLNLPEFKELRLWIEKHLNYYFHEICQIDEKGIQLFITQSWLNIQHKGDSRTTHIHSNSVVSGVFYIQGSESTPIQFERQGGRLMFGEHWIFPCKKRNEYNSEDTVITNHKNKLVLFPSQIAHGVHKNQNDEVRISLAFNTFVKGTLGYSHTMPNVTVGDTTQLGTVDLELDVKP